MRSFTEVEIGESSTPYKIRRLVIDMEPFSHESMTVEIRTQGLALSDLQEGTPIKATVTTGGDSLRFVGYIHHLLGTFDRTSSTTTLVCVGATFPLKGRSQRVWKNLSATSIARSICESNKLAYNIPPHPRVFDQLSQAGRSDWEFLTYLAKRIGYSLWASGTTVYMAPRTQIWSEESSLAPVLSLEKSGSPRVGLLKEFKPAVGEFLPTDDWISAKPFVQGVDPWNASALKQGKSKSKKIIRTKAPDDSFSWIGSKTVVNTASDAAFESDAYAERNGYPMKAKIKAFGDPNLGPNSPVWLANVPSDYEGFWIVNSIKHIVTGTEYIIEAEVLSDSSGKVNQGAKEPSNIVDPQKTQLRTTESTLVDHGRIVVLPQQSVSYSTVSKWGSTTGNLRELK